MSGRKNRSPEEQARRAKIRELLQESNISRMTDIQDLFKETIAEFMENGLAAELDDELGYSKLTTRTRTQATAETATAARRFEYYWFMTWFISLYVIHSILLLLQP